MKLFRRLPVVLLVLLPWPAAAAVCFSVTAGTASFGTMVLAIEGQGEQFFDLVGQVVAPCSSTTAASERVTLSGSARLDAAGNAEFSATVPGTATCFPYFVSGTLQAPAFASGSGRIDVPSTGQTGAVILAPAACPAQ